MGWGHLNRQHSPEITGLPPGWGAGSPPILWSNLGSAKLIFRWSGAISHILASLPVCQLVWLGLVYLCECMPAQSCPTLQSHELQPARFLCPWDFPGKNTGVGYHFLLQRIFPIQGLNVGLLHGRQSLYYLRHHGRPYTSHSEVAQSCLTLCDPMDCSLLGFSVHGIFQARVLEWVAISFSRGSSWPRD